MLTFQQKRELQKIIIEQNRILAGKPPPEERTEAEQKKRRAMIQLGIIPGKQSEMQQ